MGYQVPALQGPPSPKNRRSLAANGESLNSLAVSSLS